MHGLFSYPFPPTPQRVSIVQVENAYPDNYLSESRGWASSPVAKAWLCALADPNSNPVGRIYFADLKLDVPNLPS